MITVASELARYNFDRVTGSTRGQWVEDGSQLADDHRIFRGNGKT